jgi:arginine-tRNA-protein transferase
MKNELGNKQFFITPGHACSYLPKRQANTLFLDPRETITANIYQTLTEAGFRRSGSHLYRPHCEGCQACVPTRIPVAEFRPKRRQRRVLAKNQDLTLRINPATYDPEYYDLYARYISARHGDGDMYPPNIDQFRSFLLSQWSATSFLCLYRDEDLLAVAVTDEQQHSMSAIYTFFDPDYPGRSLGVMSILKQIELCQSLGLSHVYLGYWIRDAEKMRYKTEYRPVELFINGRWVTIS